MRLLDRVPGWRYVAIGAAAFLLILILRWIDREDEDGGSARYWCRSHGRLPMVQIHIKFRPGAVSSIATGSRPLFSRVHATVAAYDDPRDRWVLLDVPEHRVNDMLA